jgi:hypothetical protein
MEINSLISTTQQEVAKPLLPPTKKESTSTSSCLFNREGGVKIDKAEQEISNQERTHLKEIAQYKFPIIRQNGSKKELLARITQLKDGRTLTKKTKKNDFAFLLKKFKLQYEKPRKTSNNQINNKEVKEIYLIINYLFPSSKEKNKTEDTQQKIQIFLKKYIIVSEKWQLDDNQTKSYLQKKLLPLKKNTDTAIEKVAAPLKKEKFEGIEEVIPSQFYSDTHGYLKSKEVAIGEQIGEGAFGKVFLVTIDSKKFVYKEEIQPVYITDNSNLNGKMWRHGDIAASRCKDLSHFAKSIAFVLQITKPNGETEKYFVATDKIKDFGKGLTKGTKVALVGQIMKKASGVELEKLLEDKNFNPVEHFDHIANALFSFLEGTYKRNLVHRDLKPANFIYDPQTKEGTVIDFGLGNVLGKRKKMNLVGDRTESTQSGNVLYSNIIAGTPEYIAPALWRGEQYASEVDFHSAAAMLIEVLDMDNFKKNIDNIGRPETKIPTNTQKYIELFHSTTKLGETLEQHPDMAKTINLFFNVASAVPTERDQAFEALKTHMEKYVRPEIEIN